MPQKDPRVDTYIEEAAEFARPVLKRLRRNVHRGCPDVVEVIKWHVPFFQYRGLLCGMAAFKAHCAFFFWRDIQVKLPRGRSDRARLRRITSIASLPSDATLIAAVRAGAAQRDTTAAKSGRSKTGAKRRRPKTAIGSRR
ncbi:MAG TPA: DUF1801 domain-containing protein [Opitutaceae bacterium]|nr:DUF1801 domain-containing protein [Opitutaceae bacterium]